MDNRIDELAKEILEKVKDRGKVTKEEVEKTWGITDEEYGQLRKQFGGIQGIAPGPKGVGGWIRNKHRGQIGLDGDRRASSPVGPWEDETVRRLCELLQHQELEHFLGDLLYSMRRAREIESGADRRGTKTELAHALIVKHGRDLFADLEIRNAIARKCHLKDPGRWHPGKGGAHEFVSATGFPAALAGIPSENPPEDYEYLEGRYVLKPLKNFQREVKDDVMGRLKEGKRGMISLPTGAGKTRVAVEAIREWLSVLHASSMDRTAVLWLAHSGELCEQAYSEFRQAWMDASAVCPLLLVRFWGHFTQDFVKHQKVARDILRQPCVLVSTPQRIVNLIDGESRESAEMMRSIVDRSCALVIDEAHRAAAPTYVRILNFFTSIMKGFPVVGITATPWRGEYLKDKDAGTEALKDLLKQLIEAESLGDDPLQTLQERGILARPVFQEIKTETAMRSPVVPAADEPSDEEAERIDNALKLQADNTQRRMKILHHIQPICGNPTYSVLYFGPSVADAECMAFLLRQKGIPSTALSGNTRDATRREIIRDFKNGKIRVLCNCEVLTTGFDAPKVTHVVMARPTVSQVLYSQMVGRGLRGPEFGGKTECVIIKCKDHYRGEPPIDFDFRTIWKNRRAVGKE